MRKTTCICCGKQYKKWGWVHHHFEKKHPDSKLIIRVKEVADVMMREAEEFIKCYKPGGWIEKRR